MANKIVTFAQFIVQADNGQLHQDLSDELRNLIGDLSNVFATSGGKPKGKLTLDLIIKLDSGAFVFDADIKIVAPDPVSDQRRCSKLVAFTNTSRPGVRSRLYRGMRVRDETGAPLVYGTLAG